MELLGFGENSSFLTVFVFIFIIVVIDVSVAIELVHLLLHELIERCRARVHLQLGQVFLLQAFQLVHVASEDLRELCLIGHEPGELLTKLVFLRDVVRFQRLVPRQNIDNTRFDLQERQMRHSLARRGKTYPIEFLLQFNR